MKMLTPVLRTRLWFWSFVVLGSLACVCADANSMVVTNTADSGPGTLRQAILNTTSPGTITFATNLFASGPTTIMLDTAGDGTYGPSGIAVADEITIVGPGAASELTIELSNSAPAMRLFYVAQGGELTLSNLTLAGGDALGGEGGGGSQRGGGGGGGGGLAQVRQMRG
jgi:hypothetical protein